MIRTKILRAAATAILFGLTLHSNAQPALNTAFEQPPSNRLSVAQLDAESQKCMRCHDGSLGSRIELRPAGAPIEYEFGRTVTTTNHAIGMSFSTAYEANPTEYVSPSALNPNVKLVDGKVGCLSCHVQKEVLIAQTSAFVETPETQCSFDKEATRRAFGGPSCLNCHIK
ncbi:MAG: hypothetical protein AAB393_12465 [Bacteroidota bacterium]